MLKSLCVSSYVLKCVWVFLCCVSMILYFVCECVGRCGCQDNMEKTTLRSPKAQSWPHNTKTTEATNVSSVYSGNILKFKQIKMADSFKVLNHGGFFIVICTKYNEICLYPSGGKGRRRRRAPKCVSVSPHRPASLILSVCLAVSSLTGHIWKCFQFSQTADTLQDTTPQVMTSILSFPYRGSSERHVVEAITVRSNKPRWLSSERVSPSSEEGLSLLLL